MRSAECRACVVALLAVAIAAAPAAPAQTLDPRAVFASESRAATIGAEEILRCALDNLFGFDAAIVLEIERRSAQGAADASQLLLQRRRLRGARRLLAVSVLPPAVRGNRMLQINHDDGREETFAFVSALGGEPMRAPYRLAEPFLATWYAIGAGEPAAGMRALAEYEILGFTPMSSADEDSYALSLRSIAPRGYDRTELVVARSDCAILEQRQYLSGSSTPALIAAAPRAFMTFFGDRIVPGRISYRDRLQDAEIEVRLRYAPLSEGSDALFLPGTFHRVPLGALQIEPQDH
jgi:hypothetical protein